MDVMRFFGAKQLHKEEGRGGLGQEEGPRDFCWLHMPNPNHVCLMLCYKNPASTKAERASSLLGSQSPSEARGTSQCLLVLYSPEIIYLIGTSFVLLSLFY